MSKVILITGANRGLGLGLLEKYAKKDNHVVIAAVRDPQSESARRLADVATGEGTKVLVVKIDSTAHEDAFSAVEEIRKREFDLRIYKHIDTTRFDARIIDISRGKLLIA
jgi:norsolorinic acid ketoreductase